MYELLKEADIEFEYEGQKFTIIDGFDHKGQSFEKFLNGKGDFKDRGNKYFKESVYTPDFTNPSEEPLKWVIETKGRAMPDFSRTWKLFKKRLTEEGKDVLLMMPRNKKDCVKVIEILKNRGYGKQ